MSEEQRKVGFTVVAENETKATFQEIKTDAATMAASVEQAGTRAAKGIQGIGEGADAAAQKLSRAEGYMSASLAKATERTKIAAEAGNSLARAFEQKIEMRGLDASKLDPMVRKLREAESALAAVKSQQAEASGRNAFLESLRAQTDAIGKTRSELLALKAAQLGIAGDAAPYIARLREADSAVGKMGMSAAATAAAMRNVPAQFTDIVVSLQAGQAPMTVLLQQGGQLKDMFGGMGNAAKALSGYVLGLVNPFTLAAAAVAAIGFAYYQGSKEADAYRKSLALSGNQAGTSVSQLNAMAQAMKSAGITQGAAAAGLATMAEKSRVGSDSLKEFTTSAILWEKAVGQGVEETAKKFADLGKDPLKASLAINEQMNFLTGAVYDQIKALDEQGRKEEAAAIAQRAFSDALRSRAQDVKQNLGYIESGWKAVTGAAKAAWDAMLGAGRASTQADRMSQIDRELQDLNTRAGTGFGSNGGGAAFGNPNAQAIATIQARVQALQAEKASIQGVMESDRLREEQQANNKAYVDSAGALDALTDQFATKEVKRKRELTSAENTYKKAVEDTKKAFAGMPELDAKLAEQKAKFDKAAAGISDRYKDKKTGSTGGIKATDNMLAGLNGQLEAAKQYYQQLITLGVAASNLNAGERESLVLAEKIKLATDAKTIATLNEAKAKADALGVQLRTNDGLEKSLKSHQAVIDSTWKEADALAQRAREQEAANAIYGKGRTEIERMTLATLENQMAEAQGSDSFDPKYIASLEAKIAAQKRYTEALGGADYKQFEDRLTKSLETSKEELAIQKDGLSLLGLDEVTRKKIVAQRRIELSLAKEIAEIDRTKFSDDPIDNLIKQQELKKKAREKAEIDSQTSVLQIQEEYVNKQVEQYDEIFRKGFADMLNNGKDGWKSFSKSLVTTFKTTVADQIYKMFAQKIVVQIVGQFLGMSGLGGAAVSVLGGGSGGSGALGMASNGMSAYNLFSGGAGNMGAMSGYFGGTMSGANALGSIYANTTGTGISGLLATNGAYGTAPASTAGLAGAGAASAIVGAAALGWIVSDYLDKGDSFSGAAYATSGGDDPYTQVTPGALNPNMDTGDRPDREAIKKRLREMGAPESSMEGLNDRALHRMMILGETTERQSGGDPTAGGNMNWNEWAKVNKDLPDFYQGQGYASPEQLGWFEQQDMGGREDHRQWDSFFQDPAVITASRQLAEGILAPIKGISDMLGNDDAYKVATGMAWNDKTGKITGGLQVWENDESVLNWGSKEFDNKDEYLRSTFSDSLGVLENMDGVPEWLKKQVDGAQEEIAKLDGVDIGGQAAKKYVDTANSITATFKQIETLLQIIPDLSGLSQDAVYSIGQAFGTLENYTSAYSGYIQNYYSEDERANYVRGGINSSLAAHGLSVDENTTREDYRKMIEAQDLTTESGRAAYAALILASGAFAQITPAAEDAAKALAHMDDLLKTQKDLQAEWLVITGDLEGAERMRREQAIKGMKDEEIAQYDANVALEKRIEAEKEFQATISGIGSSLTNVLTEGLLGNVTGADLGGQLADAVIGGVYNALANSAAQQITDMMMSTIIDPLVRAALVGSLTAETVSKAAIENMVARTKAVAEALGMLFNDPQFKDLMASLGTMFKDIAGTTAAQPYYSSYANQQKNAQKEIAQAAERAAEQVKSAWEGVGDSLMDQVKKIRGDLADSGPDSMAYWQSQFAIETAKARAGDVDAASGLNALSGSLLDAAGKEAATLLELQQLRAWVAQSLQDTAGYANAFAGGVRPAQTPNAPTSYVPPAAFSASPVVVMQSDNRVASKLDELTLQQRNQASVMADLQIQMLRIVRRWDVEGMPEVREEV